MNFSTNHFLTGAENRLNLILTKKGFEYNPPIHNCCYFAEEALKSCGLVHCFDLGKSTGLDHKVARRQNN